MSRGCMECPFCGDKDFDLVGLKSHLLNSCEEFDKTESVLEERQRQQRETSLPAALTPYHGGENG